VPSGGRSVGEDENSLERWNAKFGDFIGSVLAYSYSLDCLSLGSAGVKAGFGGQQDRLAGVKTSERIGR
jgi:hypothetical protein